VIVFAEMSICSIMYKASWEGKGKMHMSYSKIHASYVKNTAYFDIPVPKYYVIPVV
jgi:hypothetical protein